MRVTAAGVYAIRPGLAALRDALRCHGNRDYVLAELGRLALVELEVRGGTAELDLGRLHQPGNLNVPYDERYFTLDRTTRLECAREQPPLGDFAVAFFLHAFEVGRPLRAPWGIIPLGTPQKVRPPYLRDIVYRYYD